jgi:Zn-dependent protease with chaperone function
MTTLEGNYFNGSQPISVSARMEFTDLEATLSAGPVCLQCAITDLIVSPRIGSTDRFIALPNNGQFMCADQSFLDTLPQESPSEGPVAWLEKRWGVALACIAIIICALTVGYLFGLPVVAKHIANRIPIKTEQSLGNQALAWLEKQKWLAPSTLDADAQKPIVDGFIGLYIDLPMKDYYHLKFRSSKVFRANAFALPGGIIVITDEMVKTAETPEEVLAVLAHEIGHVELRHITRSVLQNSVLGTAVAAITADAASLSTVVAGLPMLLARTKYSREFETAADDYAFRLLKHKGYSPAAFASIMERIAKKEGDKPGAFAYVSTHPLTAERVQRARNAASE